MTDLRRLYIQKVMLILFQSVREILIYCSQRHSSMILLLTSISSKLTCIKFFCCYCCYYYYYFLLISTIYYQKPEVYRKNTKQASTAQNKTGYMQKLASPQKGAGENYKQRIFLSKFLINWSARGTLLEISLSFTSSWKESLLFPCLQTGFWTKLYLPKLFFFLLGRHGGGRSLKQIS